MNMARSRLLEAELPTKDPHKLFDFWFNEVATDTSLEQASAVCVSTVSEDQLPSSRMVLLKGYNAEGFSFCTNYDSRKGQDLSSNPNAAMLFYWPQMNRQVRVEGVVERLPASEEEEYWLARPLASQITGAASRQSSVIPSREYLEKKRVELEKEAEKNGADAITKPENWGGFLLRPSYFEFWQGQSDRLHDRIIFSKKAPKEGEDMVTKAESGYFMYRLAPP